MVQFLDAISPLKIQPTLILEWVVVFSYVMLCLSELCKLKLMELMKVVATVSAMSPQGKIDNNNSKDVAIKEKAKEMWKYN